MVNIDIFYFYLIIINKEKHKKYINYYIMSTLQRQDFKIYVTYGDGNCGPRSISMGLTGSEDSHAAVRS